DRPSAGCRVGARDGPHRRRRAAWLSDEPERSHQQPGIEPEELATALGIEPPPLPPLTPTPRQPRFLRVRRMIPAPIRRALRAVLTRSRAVVRRAAGSVRTLATRKRLDATAAAESSFRMRLAATLEPSPHVRGPRVSALVLTRNGLPHLRRLLPSLEALAYED